MELFPTLNLILDAQVMANYIEEVLEELKTILNNIEEERKLFNELSDKHQLLEEQKVTPLVKEVNSLKASLAEAEQAAAEKPRGRAKSTKKS